MFAYFPCKSTTEETLTSVCTCTLASGLFHIEKDVYYFILDWTKLVFIAVQY